MRIRYLKYFLLLPVFFYAVSAEIHAQTVYGSLIDRWKNYFYESYGPDYDLINGIKYIYRYSNVDGHPFFGENRFYKGTIVINNKKYQDEYLKYDIYNQEIILQYKPFSGGKDQVLLKNKDIHEFEINNKLFRKYSFPETGTRFYQVVTKGKIFCIYSWEKVLNYSTTSLVFNFSNRKKESYLVKSNELYRFKNRRQFWKIFPAQHKKEIRKFIRKNKRWLRNRTDKEMNHLLEFCNQLIEKGNAKR